jgi:hypothetical protein
VAVDPRPGGQRQDEERGEHGRAEEAHLEGTRVEDHDRGEGQGERRHLRAELGDRLPEPEPTELRVVHAETAV